MIGKPFAMIMGLPILVSRSRRFLLEKQGRNHLQLLIVDKKVSFDGKTASFNNSYFCKDILESNIMFAHIEHNNTKTRYVGSRMFDDMPKEIRSEQAKLFDGNYGIVQSLSREIDMRTRKVIHNKKQLSITSRLQMARKSNDYCIWIQNLKTKATDVNTILQSFPTL